MEYYDWKMRALLFFAWYALIVHLANEVQGEWSPRAKKIWSSRYPEEFDNCTQDDDQGFGGDGFGGTARKNGLRDVHARWPGGIVPYEVVGPYTLEECREIESAFDQYHVQTCVRYRLRDAKDKDFVRIVNEPGCHADVGRVGGAQLLNVGEGPCVARGPVMHELMHVLGFMHEQKRYDRDEHIRIVYQNVREDKLINFHKQEHQTVTSFGVPYDYESITHYSPLAFSKNGEPTVMLRHKNGAAVNIGQRENLSKGDVVKINRMYDCAPEDIRRAAIHPKLC